MTVNVNVNVPVPSESTSKSSSSALPKTMRALELRSFVSESESKSDESDESGKKVGDKVPRPVLIEKPLPTPRRGEVLIRVAAAPINPNDILFLQDRYEVKKTLPVVPGFEGSGTVVGVGGGFIARTMLGRRVAFAVGDGDGSWAEYVTAPALRCAPLRGGVDLEAGSTMLTNPLTAWVLASRAKKEGHRAVVLTAAAGALGQMLNRLFRRQGQVVINIVRRQSQVDLLKKDGAIHVLDSSAEGFLDKLRALSAEHGASLVLDAVGGETTGQVFAAIPPGCIVRVYGMLSSAPCELDTFELVFRDKKIEGFTMYEWLRTTNLIRQLLAIMKVQGLVRDVLKTKVKARFSLDDHEQALTTAMGVASDGKVLFVP